jgi:gamma-glutamyltranspeptidase / glutathione hydrolase
MTITRYAPGGAVAAANHLAASVGAEILDRGGNAVDAAIATAAAMAVTAPHMCGLGGDLFALVAHAGGAPVALNASGYAGSGADPAALRARGLQSMPFQHDVASVTIPGCVDGWVALHDRFSHMPLADLLAPALRLAEAGFPISPTLALESAALTPAIRTSAFGSPRPLVAGRRLRGAGIARALRAIAGTGRTGFYEGPAGEELRSLGREQFTAADLAAPQAEWVQALSLQAFGHTLWTTPPNSQGYLALSGAWIAEIAGVPEDPDDEEWAFILVEAARQAAFDRVAVLHEHADGRALLSPQRLESRAAAVRRYASVGLADVYGPGGTTYLCVVDRERTGVSLIMSNGADFGSQLVLEQHGIFLQNRGMGFSLASGHPAEYGPRRRPPHTLSPLLATGPDGTLSVVLGTMGGDAQPQILLQLLARTLAFGQDLGDALTSPRWYLSREDPTGFNVWELDDPPIVRLEHHAPPSWATGLQSRGYQVTHSEPGDQNFGHAQMIRVGLDDMLCGAADPRSGDGAFIGTQ